MARLHVLKDGNSLLQLELRPDQEYIGGRGDNCQIALNDEALSRQHFKLFKDEDGWKVERLSKFGVLYYHEALVQIQKLQENDTFSIPPFIFKFSDLSGNELEILPSTNFSQASIALEKSLKIEDPTDERLDEPLEIEGSSQANEDAQESTSVESVRLVPIITMKRPGEPQESMRLEGVAWIAGRDSEAEIVIPDRKSSRKHFRIYKDQDKYFIQDLKSSNGTFVNGDSIGGRPLGLESGDSIVIGDTEFVFELKDPVLENELHKWQSEADQDAGPSPLVFLPIEIQQDYANKGAVRIEARSAPDSNSRAKTMRFALIGILLAIVGYSFLKDENSGSSTQASKLPSADAKKIPTDPFSSLSQQDQELVRRTYALAQNLFMETKYELALVEIRKVHEKIPSYLKSKEIESLAESALVTLKNKQYEEEVERKQKEAQENAKKIVLDCVKKYSHSLDVEAINTCLTPAAEIDPENEDAKKLVEGANERIEQKKQTQESKEEYRKRVKQREALFQRAKKLHDSGKLLDAVEAYERHIASTLPDPKDLKEESKKNISDIKSNIQKTMDTAIEKAQGHLANAEYRDAILQLDKVLELDPNNSKARAIYNQASQELTRRMRALYSNAVVEESVGDIESAKDKWKKIIVQDIPRGEYQLKARIKMKKYGE